LAWLPSRNFEPPSTSRAVRDARPVAAYSLARCSLPPRRGVSASAPTGTRTASSSTSASTVTAGVSSVSPRFLAARAARFSLANRTALPALVPAQVPMRSRTDGLPTDSSKPSGVLMASSASMRSSISAGSTSASASSAEASPASASSAACLAFLSCLSVTRGNSAVSASAQVGESVSAAASAGNLGPCKLRRIASPSLASTAAS